MPAEDIKDLVLLGTYTSEETARLIASALETQKIIVELISADTEEKVRNSNVAARRVSLLVASSDEWRARQIARAFAAPVTRRTAPLLPIFGMVSNLVPFLIMLLSSSDSTGAISTAYSLTLFIPNVVLILSFAIAVTLLTFRRTYSTRNDQRYVILYYLTLALLCLAIFVDISSTLRK